MMFFSPDFWGSEEYFERIRQFILYGGDKNEFIRYIPSHLVYETGEDFHRAQAYYGHVLSCFTSEKEIVARVQLCTGKEIGVGYHEVILGMSKNLVFADTGFSHWFRIRKMDKADADRGDIIDLPLVRDPAIYGILPVQYEAAYGKIPGAALIRKTRLKKK